MAIKWTDSVGSLKERIKKNFSSAYTTMQINKEDARGTDGTHGKGEANTILKGSNLIGDIKIEHDLDLSGDVEGNITSDQKSNIIIRGQCRGSITTREGNVEIEGALLNGDITAGGVVKVSGVFNGGKIEAREKIYMDGEFTGLLKSNEIEVGPSSKGEGELVYNNFISIHKGAHVDVQIRKIEKEKAPVTKSIEKKVIDLEVPLQQKS